MIYLSISVFALIFLRAFQQLNVVGGHYWLAAATSFAIATAEVAVVLQVVAYDWAAIPWVGLGGAAGVTAAMAAHKIIKGKMK